MGIQPEERFVDGFTKYDDATDLINRLAEAIVNLGLGGRFAIPWAPRQIKEYDAWGNVKGVAWGVYLVDNEPHKPLPERLSVTPRVTKKRQPDTIPAREGQSKARLFEAFGKSMTLNQWAKAVGVSWPTLNARIKAGMSMEEAIKQIALKKSA